jgi:hypothetical protein
MVRKGLALAGVMLAACGGQTAPLTITNVSAAPEAGSPECVLDSGSCVLCNDSNWHCGTTQTLPQCSYAPPKQACPSPTDYTQCLACENGVGTLWSCQATTLGLNPDIRWVPLPAPSCTP